MIDATLCEGAPRDLGLDQGRACRAALRAEFARAPLRERWPFPLGAADARLARDLKRHFPHLAESLAGLAAGSGVPERWLVRQLARELARGAPAACALANAHGASVLLARDATAPWIARRSRPEGGFACAALVRPWGLAGFAGVNETGLGVVALPASIAPGASSVRGASAVACHAPAALLAQDCLERFAKVESALDWCSGRPSGHGAALLFGDARGELAGIELRGGAHRVLRPEAASLAWADAASAGAELAKALVQSAPADAAALARALARGRAAPAATAFVDPVARRVGWLAAGAGAPDWLAL